MRMHRLSTRELAIFTYLLVDQKTNQCAVVDPVRNITPILKLIESEKLSITDILETHVHADFLSGARELKHHLKGKATIHCSGAAGQGWTPQYADRALQDRDEVDLGSVRIQAWHTPGHSPEHMSYIVFDGTRSKEHPCMALTGDFLLVDSAGRPDLLGEEAAKTLTKQLYLSIINVLPKLPDYLAIFPAHGSGSLCGKLIGGMDSSTLGYERLVNPLLQVDSEDSWMEKLLQNTPPLPSYFARMKQINLAGQTLLADLVPSRNMPPCEIAALDPHKTFLLDVRALEEFSKGFVTGSVNIPVAASFAKWAVEFIPPGSPIAVIGPSEEALQSALSTLRLVGLDQIIGYCLFKPQFTQQVEPLSTIPLAAPELVAGRKEQVCVVDVRTAVEWKNGHIANALHIELASLTQQLAFIPKNQPVYTVCEMGPRASIAASLLYKAGFKNVHSVQGGMQAWSQQKLPIQT